MKDEIRKFLLTFFLPFCVYIIGLTLYLGKKQTLVSQLAGTGSMYTL
jgi:hypothetical protein